MAKREDYLSNEYTENDKRLIKIFQEEVMRLDMLYYRAINSNQKDKAQELLSKIKRVVKELKSSYDDWVNVEIPKEYLKWATYINDSINGEDWLKVVLEADEKEVRWMIKTLGPAHLEAVNALLNTSKNYVKSSLDWMERQAISMLWELQGEKVREELAKGTLLWESLATMEDRIKRYFQKNKISWFKDRSWRLWSIDRYVDMLVRTETAIANIQGTINRAIQLWHTKFKVVEARDCCEMCAEENWKVVDVRDWAVDLPPFHPNCRWYIVVVMEDNNKEEFKLTDEMKDFTKTWQAHINQVLKHNFDENNIKDKLPMGYDNSVLVSTYTSSSYSDWNNALRSWEMNSMIKSMTKWLHNTIESYWVEAEWLLYRWSELKRPVLDNLIKTKEYSDKAFMSFSVSESDANEYVGWRSIYDKERVPVMFVLEEWKWLPVWNLTVNYWMKEEYIINNETKFKVKKVVEDKKNDYFKIYLKQI